MAGDLGDKNHPPSVVHDEVKAAQLFGCLVDELVAKGLAPEISRDSDQVVLDVVVFVKELCKILGIWLFLGKVVDRYFRSLSSQSNDNGSSDA